MNNKFRKEERLSSKKHIDFLFDTKEKIKLTEFPFMLIASNSIDDTQQYPAKMMVSVSKKNIRLAVNRNLMKRRIREVYRLHKNEFYQGMESKGKKVFISIICLDRKPVPFQLTQQKIIVLLNRLTEKSA